MRFLMLILYVISMAACKKCEQAAHYVVPMYLEISPVPKVRLGMDTITVTATVPYNTADVRLPGYPVSLKQFKPSNLFFGHSGHLSGVFQPSSSINPYQNHLFEMVPILGKQVSKNLYFEFEATDTAWTVQFKLIPKQKFDGIYNLSTSQIQYKDDCMQIDPVVVLVNTPVSHYLIKDRLNWELSPWQNDVFFYVE
jgi:hypothetical protein